MATQYEAAKWIPGTRFLVDGFRHCTDACEAYFLTHAHADHTTGLYKGWSKGETLLQCIDANGYLFGGMSPMMLCFIVRYTLSTQHLCIF